MESPKMIYFSEDFGVNARWRSWGVEEMGDVKYIRADLVQSLLPYTKHHMTCAWHVGHIDGECTCGLTKVKEGLK